MLLTEKTQYSLLKKSRRICHLFASDTTRLIPVIGEPTTLADTFVPFGAAQMSFVFHVLDAEIGGEAAFAVSPFVNNVTNLISVFIVSGQIYKSHKPILTGMDIVQSAMKEQ